MKVFAFLLSAIFGIGTPSTQSRFEEGQVWSYSTRSTDQGSTLLINKIEVHEKIGRIYHVSVNDVRVKNPRVEGGITTELPHFPVSEITLQKSTIALVSEGAAPNPSYTEGYSIWKEAFDRDEAGVFDTSVAEIVEFIESSINQSQTAR